MPPRDAAAYASEHDQAVWTTVQHILAEPDARGQHWDAARQVAFFPAAAGGLGLASAERLARGLTGQLGRTRPRSCCSDARMPRAAAPTSSLLAVCQLRLACGQQRLRVTCCSPRDGLSARSGIPYSAERNRHPHRQSPQSPEFGLMAGRSRQLVYQTLPIASASSAACRRVPALCCAPRRARMLASGCGPSPQTTARNSCRWTCNPPSGDALACRQHPAAADKAAPVGCAGARRPPRPARPGAAGLGERAPRNVAAYAAVQRRWQPRLVPTMPVAGARRHTAARPGSRHSRGPLHAGTRHR